LENDIKQRAEQLRKNAEAKIQQAQIKKQKYQQWLENQKQNNPNFRDYDENPLIIQSYEEFFVLTLLGSSFISCLILFGLLENLWDYGTIEDKVFFRFSLIPITYIVIVAIFQKFKFKNHKIKFTNRYIEFYDYGFNKPALGVYFSDPVKNPSENINFENIRKRFEDGSFNTACQLVCPDTGHWPVWYWFQHKEEGEQSDDGCDWQNDADIWLMIQNDEIVEKIVKEVDALYQHLQNVEKTP